MAILLGGFVIGLASGLLLQGININITHKHDQPKNPEKPTYNESLVDMLPNEVKQYYHNNNGMNNF